MPNVAVSTIFTTLKPNGLCLRDRHPTRSRGDITQAVRCQILLSGMTATERRYLATGAAGAATRRLTADVERVERIHAAAAVEDAGDRLGAERFSEF